MRQGISRQCKACAGKNRKNTRFIDLTGKTFGKWKVLSLYSKQSNTGKPTKWSCKCLGCNNKYIVQGSHLSNGMSTGCKKCGHRFHKMNRQFSDMKWRAIKKDYGIGKDITPQYLLELLESQNYKCAITGMNIVYDYTSSRKTTASPDRIDNNKGYFRGNIQYVHKKINKMKLDMTQKEFITLCTKVVLYTKRKK